MAVILRFFSPKSVDLGLITSKWLKIDLYSLRQKYSPKNLVFSDIIYGDIRRGYRERAHYWEARARYTSTSPLRRIWKSVYALGLIEIGLSALYGFSVTLVSILCSSRTVSLRQLSFLLVIGNVLNSQYQALKIVPKGHKAQLWNWSPAASAWVFVSLRCTW